MSSASVRDLVMAFGWNATAFQILNPGIEHWFAEDIPAVVGYVRRGRYLLAAGAPICPDACLPQAIAAFEHFAQELHCGVCFVLAEDRMLRLTEGSLDHSAVAIGAQPAWVPAEWAAVVQSRPSLRAQLNRARNKGVTVAVVPPTEAAADPEIRETLRVWTASRGMPPMRFLVEPNILPAVSDPRIVLVARRANRIEAFLVASPIPLRNGYLIELLARSPKAPNGTSELLIDAAVRHLATLGSTYVTLGLVALAQCAREAMKANPWWLRAMVTVARAHANHFYNFRGLEQFRTKMAPARWENVYVIANQKPFPLRAFYAMGGAFSGISPVWAIALALVKAVREEFRRLRS